MGIEIDGESVWMFETRSCGELPSTPLHSMLRWILEQLNFGCWRVATDSSGDGVSLILGKPEDDPWQNGRLSVSVDGAIEAFNNRKLAVNIAGLFAKAREEGIEPEYSDLTEQARMTATDAGYMNTEFHYAFELVDILQSIRANTFVFTSPPIKGIASPEVVTLLREATRAYLFRLRRSCVSLCRALVEAALRDRIESTKLLNERWQSKKGELECLITLGKRHGILTTELCQRAHIIRRIGNKALHGTEPTDTETWSVLLDTRALVEVVCK